MTLQRSLKTLVLCIAAAGLVLPPIAAALLGFHSATYGYSLIPVIDKMQESAVLQPVLNTLWLIVVTIIASFTLVVPTLIWLHLKAPHLLTTVEWLSTLPYIVPPIALVSGVSLALRPLAPGFFASIVSLVPFYVLITLPFTYRAVDTGLRALDLPTLFRAAESLGAGSVKVILTVVVPNLRGSLLVGSVLTATMVSGEFVLSSLLLHKTFPTMLVELGQSQVRLAAALSFIAMMATWALMTLIMSARATRRSQSAAALAL